MSALEDHAAAATEPARAERGVLLPEHVRALVLSTVIGLVLYAGLYGLGEYLAHTYGNRNPFYEIATHQGAEPAVLFLGASHALPLEYDDMGAEVERRVGGPVLNLAVTGGGVVPNAVFLDAYVATHGAERTRAVVYVLDSFAFYDREWNESRMTDIELWRRAPLHGDIARAVVASTWRYGVPPSAPLLYLSGFAKLNDPSTWFEEDVWDAESEFDDEYEPSDFEDGERIDFLYPSGADGDDRDRYLRVFEDILHRSEELGVPFVVVRPPLREAFRERIPEEDAFDARLEQLLEGREAAYYDFSRADYPPESFYDPDHLNREGVMRFLDEELGQVFERELGVDATR